MSWASNRGLSFPVVVVSMSGDDFFELVCYGPVDNLWITSHYWQLLLYVKNCVSRRFLILLSWILLVGSSGWFLMDSGSSLTLGFWFFLLLMILVLYVS